MDWITEAKQLFAATKPQHFGNFEHCEECADHDATLLGSSIDAIGLKELGSPAWDPMCFCTAEGMEYYFPALVRLSLETARTNDFYFAQLLFHLEYGWQQNRFILYCSSSQREFVAKFIAYMIVTYPDELEESMCATNALNTYDLWKTHS